MWFNIIKGIWKNKLIQDKIFEVLSDGKKRTANEIKIEVKKLGYRRNIPGTRAIAMYLSGVVKKPDSKYKQEKDGNIYLYWKGE